MAMMAMRTAVSLPRSSGLLRRFSTGIFDLPASNTPSQREQADPSENLFISGLNKRTTSETLREAFEKFGTVVNAKVVTDRVSGYSRGFGFVQYATVEEAKQGIQGMDGKNTLGKTYKIEVFIFVITRDKNAFAETCNS